MKKIFIALAFVFLLLPPVTAKAIVFGPFDDFFTKHEQECEYVYRGFSANGSEGFVSVKKEPGSNKELFTVKNGSLVTVYYTYNHNGVIWAVAECEVGDENDPDAPAKLLGGWLPMNELLLIYDSLSFYEEHKDELHPYTGGYETIRSAKEIVFWAWPVSGHQSGAMLSWAFDYKFEYSYTDEFGREWGYIGDYNDFKHKWVYIADPSTNIMPANNENPSTGSAQPYDVAQQKGEHLVVNVMIVIITVLAACAIISAVLKSRN